MSERQASRGFCAQDAGARTAVRRQQRPPANKMPARGPHHSRLRSWSRIDAQRPVAMAGSNRERDAR